MRWYTPFFPRAMPGDERVVRRFLWWSDWFTNAKGLREFRKISAFSPIVNPVLAPWGVKAFTGYLGENKEAWKNYDATNKCFTDRGQQGGGSPIGLCQRSETALI